MKLTHALIQAARNGYNAFKNGAAKTPCQCADTMRLIGENDGHATEILKAWLEGQQQASIEA